MDKSKSLNILSGEYTKIVVETDEENPITIAEITESDAIPADGYRIRLTPNYEKTQKDGSE